MHDCDHENAVQTGDDAKADDARAKSPSGAANAIAAPNARRSIRP